MLFPVGPVVLEHEVMPETPVICQLPWAVGVVALLGPVTVAVKVIDEPSAAFALLALTATVGVALATVVV